MRLTIKLTEKPLLKKLLILLTAALLISGCASTQYIGTRPPQYDTVVLEKGQAAPFPGFLVDKNRLRTMLAIIESCPE